MILGTLQKLKPVEMDELIRTVKEHLLKQAKDNESEGIASGLRNPRTNFRAISD